MRGTFPKVIAQLIADYAAIYTVLPWVLERAPKLVAKRHGSSVRYSRDEAEGGDDDEKDLDEQIEYYGPYGEPSIYTPDHYLWKNPMAEDFVVGLKVDWLALATNPADWALDLLEKFKIVDSTFPWTEIYQNTNPRVKWLWAKWEELNPEDVCWCDVSANPLGIEKLWTAYRSGTFQPHRYSSFIHMNPAAEGFMKATGIALISTYVCANQYPWPAALAAQNSVPILEALRSDYGRNPHSDAIARIRDHIASGGEWTFQSRDDFYTNPNPAALDIIRDNPDVFPLQPIIWSNPNIFQPTVPPGLVDTLVSIQF